MVTGGAFELADPLLDLFNNDVALSCGVLLFGVDAAAELETLSVAFLFDPFCFFVADGEVELELDDVTSGSCVEALVEVESFPAVAAVFFLLESGFCVLFTTADDNG